MYKTKQRLVWLIFLTMSLLILIIMNGIKALYLISFIKELRELLKKNSQYIEDGDWHLIHKGKIK